MHGKIVDTRKLNKDKRAGLGRFGDTEIREIDGKPAHVNALESALIDIDKKSGEKFAKDVGAGTINPYTGLKEYNPFTSILSWFADRISGQASGAGSGSGTGTASNTPTGGEYIVDELESTFNIEADALTSGDAANNALGLNLWGDQGWEFSTMNNIFGSDPTDTGFDFSIEEYMESKEKDLGQWGSSGQKTYDELAGMSAGEMLGYIKDEFGLSEDKLKYITPFDKKPLGFIEGAYQANQSSMMNAATSKASDIGSQIASAASKTGFATGGPANVFQDQMKNLIQDTRTSGDLARIGYEKDMYGEKKSQLDRFYTDIQQIEQFT